MRKKSEVEVEIVGGLGNQLFGYAAGLFLSRKTMSSLKLNLSMIGVGGTDHGKSILGFSIPSNLFIERSSVVNTRRFINRVNNKLARHFKSYRKKKNAFLGEYVATELGFEEEFWQLNKARKLKGYFQSYTYTDCVRDILIKELVIPNPTSWYLAQLDIIKEQDPIAIHVRRGDFLNLLDDFGVLDISYFESVIQKHVHNSENRKIWIFTDSPEIVAQEIQGTALQESIIVKPAPDSNVNEVMLLMSNFRTLVISNSTFSWWSAYLSNKETDIHAPSKWFKARRDPERLLPPEWNLHESIWR